MSIGAEKIHETGEVLMTLDHDVPNTLQSKLQSNARKHRKVCNEARSSNLSGGIEHQIMVEKGFAVAGT